MDPKKLWTATFVAVVAGLLIFSGFGVVSQASGAMLFQASLKNGDYGTGWAVPECPDFMVPDPSPPGIVDGAEGAMFITTETTGRSSALINWQVGDNPTFRNQGTVSFWFYADSTNHVGGAIVSDNYGFDKFRGGQGTFSIFASPVSGQVQLSWTTWHNNIWVSHEPRVHLEHDRWYELRFAWGGPENDFEICVDGQLAGAYTLPAGLSLPWGQNSPLPGGFNFGFGSNHERANVCLNNLEYTSAAGVKFADIKVWDEYQPLCQTAITVIPRYRLYNPNDFHHHYTTDPNEYLVLGSIGWIQEGTACYLYNEMATIQSVDTVPYYRLYNPNSFEHHWTTDDNEYRVLGTIGWIQEGVDGYVFASQVTGSEPLYRLYNPNDGLHLWTMDANERTTLIGYGFIDEGIACHVFP